MSLVLNAGSFSLSFFDRILLRASGFRVQMCSGSEAVSYLRRIDFVYHSTLGLRVIKREEETGLRVEG